jgi:hypothetical protein
MAWYRASRLATSTSVPPLRKVGRAGILPRFRCELSNRCSAVSTSSDKRDEQRGDPLRRSGNGIL